MTYLDEIRSVERLDEINRRQTSITTKLIIIAILMGIQCVLQVTALAALLMLARMLPK